MGGLTAHGSSTEVTHPMTSQFTPKLESLPRVLPIFPLAGATLLPRAQLPLNIFEPRYLHMTLDALRAERMIGMVQPDPSQAAEDVVYRIGCAGRITTFNETEDGRLLIVLSGICRFELVEELPTVHGYRRVVVDWHRFARDLSDEDEPAVDTARLIADLKPFLERNEVKADWESLKRMPAELVLNHLCMNLPLAGEDKQALVETTDQQQRARLLTALCEMALISQSGSEQTRH